VPPLPPLSKGQGGQCSRYAPPLCTPVPASLCLSLSQKAISAFVRDKPLKQGQNLVLHLWRMKFSGNNHSKSDVFIFIHTGCCTIVRRSTFIEFFLLPAGPCRVLHYCCYMYTAQVKSLICKWLHDPIAKNSGSNKVTNCLKN